MSNSNERTEILRLVETGKLSASEGIQLLNTLDKAPRIAPPPQPPVSTKGPLAAHPRDQPDHASAQGQRESAAGTGERGPAHRAALRAGTARHRLGQSAG